jgi:glycosyltransferase involved in cell wall biosynthesis
VKISVLNNCDIEGGAARAAYRISEGVRRTGIEVTMWVQHKSSDLHWVVGPVGAKKKLAGKLLPHLDLLPLARYPKRVVAYWSLNWLPNPGLYLDRLNGADVVHLNWVGGGYVPISALRKITRPIIWTLHDCWAYTGGCHSNAGCERFVQACGACPQLGSHADSDLSRRTWRAKQRHWAGLALTLVAPSRWLAAEAARSSLFAGQRIEVIPNGLDLSVFKPTSQTVARRILNLPEEGLLILFGAVNSTSDRNKGYDYLQAALAALTDAGSLSTASLLIFGASAPATPPALGFPVRFFGRLHDDVTLALLYSAADVMVVPSRQEAFGQTASEAMACGTPVVAFGATGLLDIVDHLENGYLARPYDALDLARGIEWVLSDAARRTRLGASARRKCEQRFDINLVAAQYITLYAALIADTGCAASGALPAPT